MITIIKLIARILALSKGNTHSINPKQAITHLRIQELIDLKKNFPADKINFDNIANNLSATNRKTHFQTDIINGISSK